jgi:hypothetical protein
MSHRSAYSIFQTVSGVEPYTNANPMPASLGGYDAGTTFNQVPVSPDLLDGLFYPHQDPSFSSFEIQGQANPLRVGDTIPANVTMTWTTLNPANIVPNSINIDDITRAESLASGIANDGSEAVVLPSGAITNNAPNSHTFRINGTNTVPPPTNFPRDKTYNWYWDTFWGKSSLAGPLTEPQVEALANSVLQGSRARTYTYPSTAPTTEYLYLGLPSSLGAVVSFIDQATGFPYDMQGAYTVNITNGNGQSENYNIYRSTFQTASAVSLVVS